MDYQQIIDITNAALVEEFELELAQLKPEASIRADLGLDSMDIVDMIIVLEKTFEFKITDRENMSEIHTLGEIYAFILAQRNLKSS